MNHLEDSVPPRYDSQPEYEHAPNTLPPPGIIKKMRSAGLAASENFVSPADRPWSSYLPRHKALVYSILPEVGSMMSITGGEVGFFELPGGRSRLRLLVQTAPGATRERADAGVCRNRSCFRIIEHPPCPPRLTRLLPPRVGPCPNGFGALTCALWNAPPPGTPHGDFGSNFAELRKMESRSSPN
jgi:hypothetical protein